MSINNPYKTPESEPKDNSPQQGISVSGIVVIVFAALQVLASAINAPTGLEMMRHGEISLIHFLSFALSTIFLGLSGLFLLLRRDSSRYAACFSLILGIAPILQWQPILYITQIAIAVLVVVFSFVHFRAANA